MIVGKTSNKKGKYKEVEETKRGIRILLKEITGQDIEVTDKIYSLYQHMPYWQIVMPVVFKMKSERRTIGEIRIKLQLSERMIYYVLAKAK